MNRAQRFVAVLALPALVFLPFFWDTSCFREGWRCQETRPFFMVLASIALLLAIARLLEHSFAALRRHPTASRLALGLPVAAVAAMVVFLDLHGGSDFFAPLRLPFWWIAVAGVAAAERWLLAGDGRVIEGEFRDLGRPPAIRRRQ
jgi:hypothetical protein